MSQSQQNCFSLLPLNGVFKETYGWQETWRGRKENNDWTGVRRLYRQHQNEKQRYVFFYSAKWNVDLWKSSARLRTASGAPGAASVLARGRFGLLQAMILQLSAVSQGGFSEDASMIISTFPKIRRGWSICGSERLPLFEIERKEMTTRCASLVACDSDFKSGSCNIVLCNASNSQTNYWCCCAYHIRNLVKTVHKLPLISSKVSTPARGCYRLFFSRAEAINGNGLLTFLMWPVRGTQMLWSLPCKNLCIFLVFYGSCLALMWKMMNVLLKGSRSAQIFGGNTLWGPKSKYCEADTLLGVYQIVIETLESGRRFSLCALSSFTVWLWAKGSLSSWDPDLV